MAFRQNRGLKPAAVVLAVCLCACSPKADVEAGSRLVDQFHADFNAARYAEIFNGADPEFRKEAKLEDFVKYESLVKTKLGDFQSSQVTNFNVLYLLTHVQVRLDYDCVFKLGKAKEVFELRQGNGKTSMVGYRIDSPLLPPER
ncbi:MAG: hypothetical protein WBW33_19995 [Bryobacteraceae bacterium]